MTALTDDQRQALAQDGFVHLPGAVPPGLVDAALRAINAALGSEGIDPARLPTFRAQSYCPELQAARPIVDLLNASGVLAYAESAIGSGKLEAVSSGQIALRFPGLEAPRPAHPHLDGMYTPTNGVPKGTIHNFTALVGITLSHVSGPDMGNLVVWPGTHRMYEQYFRERGPQALMEGMPSVDLPPARQVTAEPGDAVLCHYQLGHGIASNVSPHIRYAVYFRLNHLNHEAIHWECMTDIWREWEGMRDVVGVRT
jgi:phytanoyl-CoA dioxygenase PhyH